MYYGISQELLGKPKIKAGFSLAQALVIYLSKNMAKMDVSLAAVKFKLWILNSRDYDSLSIYSFYFNLIIVRSKSAYECFIFFIELINSWFMCH